MTDLVINLKYQYIDKNINYLLGPYYVINQKDGVVSIDYRKLRNIPDSLLKIISNFLISDIDIKNSELYEFIESIKNNKDFIKNNLDTVYLGISQIEGISSYRDKCYFNLLNSVKKYLNKTNNQEGLKILQKYYYLRKEN